MTDLSPSWAAPSRQVQFPTSREGTLSSSSFAKSQTLAHRKSNTISSASTPEHDIKSTRGFASRPRPKLVQGSINDFDNSLPPTKSIRENTFVNETAVTPEVHKSNKMNNNRSIIVFGFPPGSINEVFQFFSQFGEIDDGSNFNVECGRNWLKINYKNEKSAKLALGQNGRIMPGQFVVGCILDDHRDDTLDQSTTNSLLLDTDESKFVDRFKEEEKIGTKKMTPNLLKEQSVKKEKKMKYLISTDDPNAQPANGVVGKVFSLVGRLLFQWD